MTAASDKLAALRKELEKQGVEGFLVPRADEFQGEEVPPCAERLAWLTGFTGSAGVAAVMPQRAAVFSDGRYTLQMASQVDGALYDTVTTVGIDDLCAWLVKQAGGKPVKLGFDPMLHGVLQAQTLEAMLAQHDIQLVALADNPLDIVWGADRPEGPDAAVEVFSEKIAGRSSADKRVELAQAITDKNGAAFVMSMPDSIAWLLNIRGQDVANTPLARSYAVLHESGEVDWYIEASKITSDVRRHIGNKATVCAPDKLEQDLEELAAAAQKHGKPVFMDFGTAPFRFWQVMSEKGAQVEDMDDPAIIPRACKTAAEQKAIKNAHVRDGVALARFLKWVDDEAPKGGLTEQDIVDRLYAFRLMDPQFKGNSFDTISGWGANGAIVHYRVDAESNAAIKPPGLLLVDSGGQYADGGTTDITRTISVGKPSKSMKAHFTKALKGHIAIAAARFPQGTTGHDLDVLARHALWQDGEDFAHGTGHGVGCYLTVHESGCGISKRAEEAFKPGMLVSNEPGYYKEGAYGIRIENLVLVQEQGKMEDGKRALLAFETVSLAPIDRRLIDKKMLDKHEVRWLDLYHKRVYKTLKPHLKSSPDVRKWLKRSCAPL